MINFYISTNKNKKEHNSKLPYITDDPFRILVIGSGSEKINALLNLMNIELDIDKMYLHAKDPYKEKCQFLIHKREKTRLKHFNDRKAFIDYSNNMQVVYKNIDENNIGKKRETMIFDDMIASMINNKKLNPVVIGLFIRGRKSNISIAFIKKSYF